jgi:AcrR family transcriptional regulator
MSERSVTFPPVTKVQDPALVTQRQTEIIRGAVKVFKEKGFHLTTVRDIGIATGMTQGTLYNYVRSKEDILFLVCDHLVQDYQDAVTAAIAAEANPARRLTAALFAVAERMEVHQHDLLLLYQEVHALDRDGLRAVLKRVSEFIDEFVTLLEESRGHGLLDFPDVYLGAEIITFLPVIVALRRWRLTKYADPSKVVAGLVSFMSRGLGVAALDIAETSDGAR